MNHETQLLSKVVQTRDLTPLLENNITDGWFADPADRKVVSFLLSHNAKYRECPSLEVINENFQFEVFYILTLYMKSYLEMNRRPLEDKLKQLKNQLSRN
jgi:hypothetical protein